MELREVFEPVLNFIKNFQKKDKEITSKQAAKDRLKLVLMQDRASVSPDFFEMMKKEIIDVIKKYIEIDEESLEVELTRGVEVGLEGPALYANIPIKNVKPVAPKSENDEEENTPTVMTEQQAEEVAEKLLNHAEQIMNKAKEEGKISEEVEIKEEIKVEEDKPKEEVEEPKKQIEKKATKTTRKTTSKTASKKTTASKTKKETKK
mgnify:FL=1